MCSTGRKSYSWWLCAPQAERVTVGGYVLVKGVPLHKTEAAADPLCSINTPLPQKLFKKQSKYDIDSISINDMMYGSDYIADKIKLYKEEGKRIIVFDSLSQDDMDLIADAVIKSGVNFIAVDPGAFTATVVSKLINKDNAKLLKKYLEVKRVSVLFIHLVEILQLLCANSLKWLV